MAVSVKFGVRVVVVVNLAIVGHMDVGGGYEESGGKVMMVEAWCGGGRG